MKDPNKSIKLKIKEEPLSEDEYKKKPSKKTTELKNLDDLTKEELISLLLNQNSQKTTKNRKRKNLELSNGAESSKKIKIEKDLSIISKEKEELEKLIPKNADLISKKGKKNLLPLKIDTEIVNSVDKKIKNPLKKSQIITSTPYKSKTKSDSDNSSSSNEAVRRKKLISECVSKQNSKEKRVSSNQKLASDSSSSDEAVRRKKLISECVSKQNSKEKRVSSNQKLASDSSSSDEAVRRKKLISECVSKQNSKKNLVSSNQKLASDSSSSEDDEISKNDVQKAGYNSGSDSSYYDNLVESSFVEKDKMISRYRNSDVGSSFPEPITIKMEKSKKQRPVPTPIRSSEKNTKKGTLKDEYSDSSCSSENKTVIKRNSLLVPHPIKKRQSSDSESDSEQELYPETKKKSGFSLPKPIKKQQASDSESSSAEIEPEPVKKNKIIPEKSSDSESSSEEKKLKIEQKPVSVPKPKRIKVEKSNISVLEPIQTTNEQENNLRSSWTRKSKENAVRIRSSEENTKKGTLKNEYSDSSCSSENKTVTKKNSLLVPHPIKKRQSSDSESGSEKEQYSETKKKSDFSLPKPIKKHQASDSESSSAEIEPEPVKKNKIIPEKSSDSESSSEEEKLKIEQKPVSVPKPKRIKVEKSNISVLEPIQTTNEQENNMRSSWTQKSQENAVGIRSFKENTKKGTLKDKYSDSSCSSENKTVTKKNSLLVPHPIKKRQSSDSESGSEKEQHPETKKKSDFSLPKPIKKQQASDSESSSAEIEPEPVKKNKIIPEKSSDSESSSEEEKLKIEQKPVSVPKPKRIKVEKSNISVLEPIQTTNEQENNMRSSWTQKSQENAVGIRSFKENTKKGTLKDKYSDSSCSSENKTVTKKNSLLVPHPIKKRQSSDSESGSEKEQHPETKKKSDFSLPKPIKKQQASDSESSSAEIEPEPVKKNKIIPEKSSDSESSSEEEKLKIEQKPVSVPKPKRIKVEKSNISVLEPIQTTNEQENNMRSSWTQKSQENAVGIRSFKENTKKGTLKDKYSDSSCSSENKTVTKKNSLLVPHPIKKRQSSDSESGSEKEQYPETKKKSDFSLPKPIKKQQASDSESSSAEIEPEPVKKNKIIPEKSGDSESSSEEEKSKTEQKSVSVPKPKRIKVEKSNISVLEQENIISDMEENNMRSSWTQKSQENALNWFEKLKQKYPNFEKQHLKLKLPKTAKFSLLQLPKNFDPNILINKKLHLKKPTLNILNQKEYIFEPLSLTPNPILVSLHKPKLIHLESVISLQKFVPKLILNQPEIPIKNVVTFPEAIKERHPLFGVDFKGQLAVGKSVKKRLKEADVKRREVEEKIRKKKMKNLVEEDVLNIFNAMDASAMEKSKSSAADDNNKKKRKRQSNASDESLEKFNKKKVFK